MYARCDLLRLPPWRFFPISIRVELCTFEVDLISSRCKQFLEYFIQSSFGGNLWNHSTCYLGSENQLTADTVAIEKLFRFCIENLTNDTRTSFRSAEEITQQKYCGNRSCVSFCFSNGIISKNPKKRKGIKRWRLQRGLVSKVQNATREIFRWADSSQSFRQSRIAGFNTNWQVWQRHLQKQKVQTRFLLFLRMWLPIWVLFGFRLLVFREVTPQMILQPHTRRTRATQIFPRKGNMLIKSILRRRIRSFSFLQQLRTFPAD